MYSELESIVLVENFFGDFVEDGNLDEVEDFVSVDYIGHDFSDSGEIEGTKGVKDTIQAVRNSFDGFEVALGDTHVSDNRVVSMIGIRGDQNESVLGIDPSPDGQTEIFGVAISLIEDGKIREQWLDLTPNLVSFRFCDIHDPCHIYPSLYNSCPYMSPTD
ncbi:ester cyclase [Haladaptatus sp. AB618]|uniref:ester cyclase n=1 Tax=Haladaptatus sp. AB618 TaxID=2934173 RepID=UPI00209C0893|nr:ester cyclase [Haladaptatus sp. AB618]MCO8254533.1 ester cyclase [Haladaptatus sp. AB618]